MADTTDVILAFGLGAAIVLGVVAITRQRQASQQQRSDPRLVSHNVVRDDEGRIRQVETFRGLDGGATAVPGGTYTPEANGDVVVEATSPYRG